MTAQRHVLIGVGTLGALYGPPEMLAPPAWGDPKVKEKRIMEQGYDGMRHRGLAKSGVAEGEIARLRSQAHGKRPPHLMSGRERELRAKAEKIMARPDYWQDENLQADVRALYGQIADIARDPAPAAALNTD